MVRRELTNLGAHFTPVIGGKREQRTDFVKAKPELACTADESKRAGLDFTVGPPPTGGAWRMWHHVDALVVADGLDVDPGAPGKFANRDRGI